jgi:hypothetical protein
MLIVELLKAAKTLIKEATNAAIASRLMRRDSGLGVSESA